MKIHTIKILATYLCFFIIAACSSDDTNQDEDPTNNSIQVSIDEYPRTGDIVTTLTSSLSGTVTYRIISQSVPDAILLNGEQATVGDWLAYDFESRSSITATIEASNSLNTEIKELVVNINNVDDIRAFLGDNSRNAYDNANSGNWVLISESEYNDLANYLASISKCGATDNQIYNNTSVSNNSGDRTIANNNDNTIPTGNYLFAFKYYSWINNVVSNKVKLSQGDAGGPYEDLGNTLPEHNDEFNHFVLKGANMQTESNGYLGMYTAGSIGVKDDNSNSYKWRNGDVDNLDNTASGIVYLHQGLSTTLKQWD